MRILVSGIPGAGKTFVIDDVLKCLRKGCDWQDVIRYSDTIVAIKPGNPIDFISSESFLKRLYNDKSIYNRDLAFVNALSPGMDCIVEYAFGDRPEPAHAAFFDVILNVSQFNYAKKFITVVKNRYGKSGQLLSFEIVEAANPNENGINITERKYVE